MLRTITAADLLCPCCHTGRPHPALIDGLNLMQEILHAELTIHSGCRCPKHNATVGGVPHSEHLDGDAADVSTPSRSPLELYLAADQYPPFTHGGIGLNPAHFIHVDRRPHRSRWFRVDGKDHPITDYLTR